MNICKHTQPIYNVIQFASFLLLLLLLSTRKIIIIIKTFNPVLKILYCSFFLYMIYFFQMKNICRWWWCFNFRNLQACGGGGWYHVPPPSEDTLCFAYFITKCFRNCSATTIIFLLLSNERWISKTYLLPYLLDRSIIATNP